MIAGEPTQIVHAKKGLETPNATKMQRMLNRYTRSMPQVSDKATPPFSPQTIVIVGSTGFLGPYIVASLLRAHPASEITCFNRSDDGEQRTLSSLQDIMGTYRPRANVCNFSSPTSRAASKSRTATRSLTKYPK
jgi:FlaA1/EpsC-like NDP-sugar epimerase